MTAYSKLRGTRARREEVGSVSCHAGLKSGSGKWPPNHLIWAKGESPAARRYSNAYAYTLRVGLPGGSSVRHEAILYRRRPNSARSLMFRSSLRPGPRGGIDRSKGYII